MHWYLPNGTVAYARLPLSSWSLNVSFRYIIGFSQSLLMFIWYELTSRLWPTRFSERRLLTAWKLLKYDLLLRRLFDRGLLSNLYHCPTFIMYTFATFVHWSNVMILNLVNPGSHLLIVWYRPAALLFDRIRYCTVQLFHRFHIWSDKTNTVFSNHNISGSTLNLKLRSSRLYNAL